MPPEQRVRRHNRGDLAQHLQAQSVRPRGELSAVIVREPQPLASKLSAQKAILSDQIADDLPLLSIQPTRQDGEQELEGQGVDHGRSTYHRAAR